MSTDKRGESEKDEAIGSGECPPAQPAESVAKAPYGPLVPARNGGMIHAGAYPGTQIGIHKPGRPANKAREIATRGFEKGAAEIERRLSEQAEKLAGHDLARFTDTLGRYGPGQKVDVSDHVREQMARAFVRAALPHVGATLTPELLEGIAKELSALLADGLPEASSVIDAETTV